MFSPERFKKSTNYKSIKHNKSDMLDCTEHILVICVIPDSLNPTNVLSF